ncbi:DoxX family protein [Qipengyuania soli]|uniref:DoxX family protein n=1 Tax=Qipengyuania soli TaxID=2782568 RepID=A0A7S8IUJ5_9SPHN|nr:DoxX family protein [Qipengyuania soli]QPC99079.1 DoxX family protein [Qipengyuania soli]
MTRVRTMLRYVMGVFYALAGYAHLASPEPFLTITPRWVPLPETVVFWTGVAELLGALALVQGWYPKLRKAGAIGLALYAVCVFPANIHHFALDMARPDGGLGLGYHVPRMFAQPLLVWLALWTGGVTDWPLRRR